MNGVAVDYNQSFFLEKDGVLASEKMEFPGDPKASAGNVVNCRCSLGVRPKRQLISFLDNMVLAELS